VSISFVSPVPETVNRPVIRLSEAMASVPTFAPIFAVTVSDTCTVYVVLNPLTVAVITCSPAIVLSNPEYINS